MTCIEVNSNQNLHSPSAWMQEAISQRSAMIAKLLLCSLSVVIITFLTTSAFAQKEDSSISWLASGDSTTNFTIENLGFSMTLEGSHQEVALRQSRSPFTNLFTGWHLISQDFTGEGTDNTGELHAVNYKNQSIFFSFGFDWYLANFAHLQPFLAYGVGASTYSATSTSSSGTVTPYEESTSSTDIGMYGFNLILEITGKIWLGYAMNYFVESQTIKYDSGDAIIEPQSSQTLLLVWNWDRVPVKAVDPKASLFGF